MKRAALAFLIALLLLGLFGLLGGCAPGNQALRTDAAPAWTVRTPLAEPPDVSLRSTEIPRPPADPFSPADEYRDRWLKVFDVEIAPSPPAEPDSAGEIR